MQNVAQAVKRLAVGKCANYGNRGYCWLQFAEEHRCVFLQDVTLRCRYFEKAVLPADSKVEALYRAALEAKAG